ncbi:MAG: NADH:flavin oxidoreductase/NADH oxidase family protein [Polyangiales bacterium]
MDCLAEPLTLPCGAVLRNRIAKAAMTEGLADADDRASKRLATLYRRWSEGGAGLHLTGNVMVDRRYLERPGNVVIDQNGGHDALRAWSTEGTRGDNHLWMQINHPGRQCTRMSSNHPVSASSERMRGMMGLIAPPRALEVDEIHDIIRRFAEVARTAKACGFTGVQIHSAHGYLASQFLSPRANHRTDEWGGSLENRARFLLETYGAVREAVGSSFPVSVKLNSADFQKGGFTKEESARVAGWLSERGLDLLEISGGTYEQMALLGHADPAKERKAASTRNREAYFLEYARDMRASVRGMPLMVTGGFRTPRLMREAVRSGDVDVIGIARPFCVLPGLVDSLLSDELDALPSPEGELRLGPGIFDRASPIRALRTLNGQAEVAWFYRQLIALSEDREPDLALGVWPALMAHLRTELGLARRRTFKRSGGGLLPADTERQTGG